MKATSSETAASAPGAPRSISLVMPVSLVISAGSGTTGSTSVVNVSTISGPRMMAARDLDDLVAIGVVARRLEIDDRDLLLEPEGRRPRALGKRRIGGAHVRVGSGHEVGVEWFRSHPPRVACDSDTKRLGSRAIRRRLTTQAGRPEGRPASVRLW